MATRTVRLETLEREIKVIGAGLVGDALKAKHIQVAKTALSEEQAKQSSVFGAPLPYLQAVDGVPGAPLAQVKAGGVIRFDFSALREIVVDAEMTLIRLSPYAEKQPRRHNWPHYRETHLLFINGLEVPDVPARIAPGAEVIFINALPYSRRIEFGWSTVQAPDGVYEVAEKHLRRRWGQAASIDFTYRAIEGGALVPGKAGNLSGIRFPALVIKSRSGSLWR